MSSESPTSPAIEPVKATHHEIYYFEDGVVFLVERTLFKVPRYMFKLSSSDVFESMFSLPHGSEGPEGLDDANPIRLEGVTSIDFANLLVLLYPLNLNFEPVPYNSWSQERWNSILKLAHMWEMAEARSLAIRNLNRFVSGIAKVTLGRKYDHQGWILDGFTDLSLRAEMLTETEACQLNLKDILKCAEARESIRAQQKVYPVFKEGRLQYGSLENLRNDSVVQDIIRKTFVECCILSILEDQTS